MAAPFVVCGSLETVRCAFLQRIGNAMEYGESGATMPGVKKIFTKVLTFAT
ncbi:hypothetical protein [Dyella agri]|uniref:Uncharacterized protein n=1 Tax=Dyella agri TaxID=1926869 RepID=A0ABW8KJ95_9GAMM